MRCDSYHEAGHIIAAAQLQFLSLPAGLKLAKSSTSQVNPVPLSDYFEEDALMLGKLKPKNRTTPHRSDYKRFYSILIVKLSGNIAAELVGCTPTEEVATHQEEDTAFVRNTLNLLKKRPTERYCSKMRRTAKKIIRKRWQDIEEVAAELEKGKTNTDEFKERVFES